MASKAGRIVEIFSARAPEQITGSLGSGYLLGAGLVLTARHVLAPKTWGVLPEAPAVFARALAEGEAAELRRAEIIWPLNHTLLSDPEQPDVAVLRLPDFPAEYAAKVLVGSAELDGSAPPTEVKVSATGFPSFMEDRDRVKSARRDTAQLTATTEPLTGLRSRTFILRNPTLQNRDSARPLDWTGISGAALFAHRSLIGVVVTQANEQFYDFRAIRLGPLLQRPDFVAAIAAGAEIDAIVVGRSSAPPEIGRHLCLLDREDQEEDLWDALTRCCPPQQLEVLSRPLFCVVPGHWDHLPDELLERFRRQTLPRRGWPTEGLEFHPLGWPNSTSPTAAISRLRARLWNALHGQEPNPTDPAAFRERLRDLSLPRLFYSEISAPEDGLPVPEVLAAWIGFWDQLGTEDRMPPVYVLLAPATTYARLETLIRSLVMPEGVHVATLPELGDCTPLHIASWLRRDLPSVIGMRAEDAFLGRLRGRLSVRFPRPFPLLRLKEQIDAVALEAANV
ncbi:MAG: trypsin-like peptidase domain-containing protein [Geminicoccaceae bacterium]